MFRAVRNLDKMNVTLKQLKVFTTITQEGSITAASMKLNLTKSAVSMALSELERLLDRKLFDRSNNHLILNEQGRRLLPLADELLDRATTINQIFEVEGETTGTLRIGSSYTIGNNLLPTLLGDFRKETGYRHQSLHLSNSTETCAMLLDFELDIGFIEADRRDRRLAIEPWMTDEMVVVCAPGTFSHKLSPIPLNSLDGHKWVLRELGSGTRECFLQEIGYRLNHWEEAFALNSTTAIVNAVAAGLGLGFLSKRCVTTAVNFGKIEILPLPFSITRQFSLVYNKEKYQSPVFKILKILPKAGQKIAFIFPKRKSRPERLKTGNSVLGIPKKLGSGPIKVFGI